MTLAADGLITVNGIDFAVGLVWSTVETDARLAQRARQSAHKLASDPEIGMRGEVFCLRHPGPGQQMPQFGIGFRALGHRPKLPAAAPNLAAAIAAQPDAPESWVGVFRTPDRRYWCLHVNDEGAILSETLIDREEDAREYLEQRLTIGAGAEVYAPAAWQLGTPLSLADLLGGRAYPLQPVSSSRTLVGLLAAAAAAAVAAWFGWSTWQDMEAARVAAELEAQRRAAEQAGLDAKAAPRLIPPWFSKPPTDQYLVTCARALRATIAPLPGWDVKTGSCGAEAITIEWVRTTGLVWWAARAARESWPDGSLKVGDQGNEATLTIAVPRHQPRGEEPIWPGGQGVRALWSIGQVLGAPVQISTATPDVPPPLPGAETAPAPKAPWNAFAFEFVSSMPADQMAGLLGQVPGIVFTTIVYSLADGLWTYKGILHEAA